MSFRRVTLYAALLLLIGCGPSDKEKQIVSEMTGEMRTWGVGRFLVDLPASWQLGTASSTLFFGYGGRRYDKVDVHHIKALVSIEEFEASLAQRIRQIKSKTNYTTNSSVLLRASRLEEKPKRQSILLRYHSGTLGDSTRIHELHLLLEDTYILFQAKSFEGLQGLDEVTTRDQMEAKLITLASQTRLVRTGRGTGFDMGAVIIDGDHDHERATLKFKDPERRDLNFEVTISAMTQNPDRLFDRTSNGLTILQRLGVGAETLRTDRLYIGGMRAEEKLLATTGEGPAGEKIRALVFAAETYREKPSFSSPTLTFNMKAGGAVTWLAPEVVAKRYARQKMMGAWTLPNFAKIGLPTYDGPPTPPVTSSLSDYEATAIWETVLKSVQPRVGAVRPPKVQARRVSVVSYEEAAENKRVLDAFIAEYELVGPQRPKEG